MKAYRYSINFKLGLIVFAVLIAVASLVYTNHLVERLREREQFILQLWASAQEHLASASRYVNPHIADFHEMEQILTRVASDADLSNERRSRYRKALAWARSMPPVGEVTLASEIVLQGQFGIPAIIADSTMRNPLFWHNVQVPDSIEFLSDRERIEAEQRLASRMESMASRYQPIAIELGPGDAQLKQYIFYDDSRLVRELRIYPYAQLLFVGLFVLVGYMGFSYLRRSEQSSLWAGMAKEAAHQLGTPISSLMGWIELIKLQELTSEQQRAAVDEVEKDVARLRRVAGRFSDIGSLPKLEPSEIAPVVESTAEYMRRRMPQHAQHVDLTVSVEAGLRAPLNVELFEWVVENLLKNALDAIETEQGHIEVQAYREDRRIYIDISDTGKGIDRRHWKDVFRPGYSTKKRGWGLGLSLAKRIVEDYHGGSLSLVHSRVGQGSKFRIALPNAGDNTFEKSVFDRRTKAAAS